MTEPHCAELELSKRGWTACSNREKFSSGEEIPASDGNREEIDLSMCQVIPRAPTEETSNGALRKEISLRGIFLRNRRVPEPASPDENDNLPFEVLSWRTLHVDRDYVKQGNSLPRSAGSRRSTGSIPASMPERIRISQQMLLMRHCSTGVANAAIILPLWHTPFLYTDPEAGYIVCVTPGSEVATMPSQQRGGEKLYQAQREKMNGRKRF